MDYTEDPMNGWELRVLDDDSQIVALDGEVLHVYDLGPGGNALSWVRGGMEVIESHGGGWTLMSWVQPLDGGAPSLRTVADGFRDPREAASAADRVMEEFALSEPELSRVEDWPDQPPTD